MDNIANKILLDIMDKIKSNPSEQDQMTFMYSLVNTKFVLPVVVDAVPDENGKLPENVNYKFFSIKNTEDKIFLVTFTNTDYFQEWQPDIMKYHVVYDYDQVEKIVAREGSGFAGFIIDPNHANVAVENETLKNITRSLPADMAVKAERIITENNIGLMPVENPPEKLIKGLKDFMSGYKSINEAYFMQTFRKGEDAPTYIIVVDFLGSVQRVFDDVAKVAQDNLDEVVPIGIMPAYDKVAKKYIENVEPFYKK
jgi:sseB protein